MLRLDRGIQYAATSPYPICAGGILYRPVKPGDDCEWLRLTAFRLAHMSIAIKRRLRCWAKLRIIVRQ
jgi:hypothetical protein